MRWRLALGCAVLSACVGTFATPALAVTGPREVDGHDVPHADAEVFMLVRATPDEVAAVRREIEASTTVKRFAFLDHTDALEEFQRIFRDEPDLTAKVDAASLPESFRVEMRRFGDRARFKKQFDRLAGVDVVKLPKTARERDQAKAREAAQRTQCGVDSPIEVFLPPSATAADEATVQAALRARPEVTSVKKVDRAAAKKVFNCLYADEPDLTRNVDADSLPVSFRVEVRKGTDLRRLASRLESIRSVDEVEVYG